MRLTSLIRISGHRTPLMELYCFRIFCEVAPHIRRQFWSWFFTEVAVSIWPSQTIRTDFNHLSYRSRTRLFFSSEAHLGVL